MQHKTNPSFQALVAANRRAGRLEPKTEKSSTVLIGLRLPADLAEQAKGLAARTYLLAKKPDGKMRGMSCVALARSLLGDPARLHYLCWCPTRQRRVWSTRLQPLQLSVADAIAAAPRIEFAAEEVFCIPVVSGRVCPVQGHEGHHKFVWGGKGVVRLVSGRHLLYPEFLAAARGENLPNRWFLHSSELH